MNPEFILRLGLAAVISGLIGWEREVYQKPAGFRTHMLVGLGSCLLTILSVFAVSGSYDHSRLIAAVVMGIGFLGAGVIIKTEGKVYGLTTAATIWFVSALGVSIGLGIYDLALFSFVLAMIALQMKYTVGEEIEPRKGRNTGKAGKKGR